MKKILVIEDEALLRKNTVRMIELTEELGDILVEECSDAREALHKIRSFQPDLIISDFMMPVMNGNSFLAHLRKIEQYTSTPVIFLSAKPDVASLIQDAHTSFLMKPFLYKELIRKIIEYLDY
jgi:CheY-like chemotaxis protein